MKTKSKSGLPEDVGLEMHSGDEEEDGNEIQDDTDDEVDEFPEIDAASDSGSEEEEEEEEEEDTDSLSDEGTDDGDSDDTLHVFPKAKVVQSDITGEPKKVYPDIEPDYDSDSSTEDVSITYNCCT